MVKMSGEKDKELLKACKRGRRTEYIERLIKEGASVNCTGFFKQTPLHHAARFGHTSAISLLMSHGAELEANAEFGNTPRHLAALYGHTSAISLLITHGSHIEAKNKKERTPYDLANKWNHRDICDLLEAAQKFPREFQYLSVQDESTFHQTLQSGIYSSHVGKLMCVGPEGVGKTAIVSVLRDVEPSKIRVSTEGIDLHTYKAAINREEEKWIPSELNAMDVLIRDLALEGKEDSLGDDAESQNPEPDNLGDEDDNETSAVGIEEHPNNDKDVNALASNDHEKNKDTDKSKQKPMKPQFQREETKRSISIKELLEMVKRKTMKGLLERALAPVNMMDFGGQAAFYSTHQSFLTYRGLYILVIDGSKGFDDVIDTEDFLPGRHGKPTSREFTYFWVNSIQAYSKGESENFPKILVVCTHRDKVPSDEADQRAEKIFLEIEKMFSDTPAEKHLILDHRIFLNAMDPEDPGYNTLKEVLVQQICSQPSWGEKLPKAWIPLKMMINQKLEEGEMIMSVDMLREINRHNPVKKLSEQELTTFLKIQHAQGEIIHFPIKGLQEHIIISPAFLVDALKSLVTDKRFCEGRRKSALQSMNQSGVLNREDIECIWKEEKRFFEHKQYLLSLMEHLDIIATPRQYGEDGKLLETDTYYVPSLVKSVNDTNYLELDFKSRSIGLSLKFKSEILPPAIGYRFIASSIDVHEIRNYNGRDMLFSGMVVLGVNKKTDLLILLRSDRIDIFLVHKTSKGQITKSFASSTLDCLHDMLMNILESFRKISSEEIYSPSVPLKRAYPCYAVAAPCYDNTRSSFTCKHGHTITMEEKEKWFLEKNIVSKMASEKKAKAQIDEPANKHKGEITDRQLANLSCQLMKEECYSLVINLGLEKSEIDAIEHDNPSNLMNIKFLWLREWKERFNGSIQDLLKAAEIEQICLEKIYQMDEDKTLPDGLKIVDAYPSDLILDLVAKQVIDESLLFCVYLGIEPSFWIELKKKGHIIVDINREVLFRWRRYISEVNKMEDIVKAWFSVDKNIEDLLTVQ